MIYFFKSFSFSQMDCFNFFNVVESRFPELISSHRDIQDLLTLNVLSSRHRILIMNQVDQEGIKNQYRESIKQLYLKNGGSIDKSREIFERTCKEELPTAMLILLRLDIRARRNPSGASYHLVNALRFHVDTFFPSEDHWFVRLLMKFLSDHYQDNKSVFFKVNDGVTLAEMDCIFSVLLESGLECSSGHLSAVFARKLREKFPHLLNKLPLVPIVSLGPDLSCGRVKLFRE